MTTDNENEYFEGLPEYIEVLEDAKEKHPPKRKPKTDYRKKIETEGARRYAEWRLRKTPAPKPKGQTTPTTPKAPNTPSKPKADHGKPPTGAPAGQSYYWAEPNKGGQHE